jgi:hypothetical protein
VWRKLALVARTCRCFRCLEVFEADQIFAANVPVADVSAAISAIANVARGLRWVTLARFIPDAPVVIAPLLKSAFLNEISLRGQDLVEPLSPFVLPRQIHSLDFRDSRFTSKSLLSLLTSLSSSMFPLTLRLARLRLSDDGWRAVFDALPSLPKIPLLRELDWSGNPISARDVEPFASYFFHANTLRFVHLDAIFAVHSAGTLRSLMQRLAPGEVWGVSLRGATDLTFGGSLGLVLDALEPLGDLAMLFLDRQLLTLDDTALLLKYVTAHPGLCELSCDGTALPTADSLFAFYESLSALPQLIAIGAPTHDLGRLFHGAPPPDSVPVDRLRAQLQEHTPPTNASVRSFYNGELNTDGPLGLDLYSLWKNYPRAYVIGHTYDPYWLLPPVTGSELFSLAAEEGAPCDLGRALAGAVRGPFELPAYPPPPWLLRELVDPWEGLLVKIRRSPMPPRYSSAEAAYADEPGHPDLVRGLSATLRKEEQAERAVARRPSVVVIPPAPAEVRTARKSLAYYQSFGEGLTINLELPIAPLDIPEPPDEDGLA